MRVSAPTPAVALDGNRRLLVVADASCSAEGLCREIQARLDGALGVHLVVPVRVSHLHFLTNDEEQERRNAEQTMLIVVGLLRQRGVSAGGSVGSDKPLESMSDALGAFPATHVLLATPPAEESYWLERDLLAKARTLTKLPIKHTIVPFEDAADRKSKDGADRAATTLFHQVSGHGPISRGRSGSSTTQMRPRPDGARVTRKRSSIWQ